MPRRQLILTDRAGLVEHLNSAGTRALADGVNPLIAHHWPERTLPAGRTRCAYA